MCINTPYLLSPRHISSLFPINLTEEGDSMPQDVLWNYGMSNGFFITVTNGFVDTVAHRFVNVNGSI